MRKILLAASAAVLTIAAPVYADKGGKGGGQGNGGGDHGGQSMNEGRGHGGGHGGDKGGFQGGGDSGRSMRVERGHGNDNGGQALREAGNGNREMKIHGNGRRFDDRQAGYGRSNDMKMRGKDRHEVVRNIRRDDREFVDNRRGNRDDFNRFANRDSNDRFGRFANDCPPGLAKKDNGCLPPGQAKKFLGARLQNAFANSQLPYQYRSWYRDDGNHFFRSGDGYIYRVNRSSDLVDGLIPLFGNGGYYAAGEPWPDSYNFYNVPYQYRDYYADTPNYNYRYGDGAIYRVNSGSGVIDGIVALLAGDLGVGQQLPNGYDVYNVPFQYRDRYYDTADNMYRYNDGYIYQVDTKTRLISAVIDAII